MTKEEYGELGKNGFFKISGRKPQIWGQSLSIPTINFEIHGLINKEQKKRASA